MLEHRRLGITVVGVELECPNCRRETRHDVHYVAHQLHWLECLTCGHRWEVDHRRLRDRYLRRMPGRLASKPARLAEEARLRPLAFAFSMPARLVTKPARMATEMGALAGILDE